MSSPRWGDEDDEEETTTMMSKGGLLAAIPPTHKSRIDKNGVQIVTSYRRNASDQLIKTITKLQVETIKVREPKMVEVRRHWKKFGQALKDHDAAVQTTVRSKEDIFIEDPNADTDLQDEDPAGAISGNLNAFWAKQQRRQLERKYDVEPGADDATAGGWTAVTKDGASMAGSAMASSAGKYVPPAARGEGGLRSSTVSTTRTEDLTTIRVTNISENTTELHLSELFGKYGRISRVFLAKDKETMVSRGFAFVSFVNKDDAARAMEELQGVGYDHLILKLEWARRSEKDPATSGTQYRSGYGKALAQDTTAKVSYASNLTK